MCGYPDCHRYVNKQIQDALWVAYTGRGLVAWQYCVQGLSAPALQAALQLGQQTARSSKAVAAAIKNSGAGGTSSTSMGGINATNPEGWTALHVASGCKQPGYGLFPDNP